MKSGTLMTRILAVLLVVCMIAGMTPAYAWTEGEVIEKIWIGGENMDADGYVHVNFTPEKDGFYYLASHDGKFEACADGPAPLSSFRFADNHGCGPVFELTANKTYCFKVPHKVNLGYWISLIKVNVADDFTLMESFEGCANTTMMSRVMFDGALELTFTVDDPSVATVDWDVWYREIYISFRQPGKTTMTVTSHNGIVKTCEITVKEPEAFVAGETKTVSMEPYQTIKYEFTPEESGSYTLYTVGNWDENPANLGFSGGISSAWEQNGYRGVAAFDLKAGETYIWEIVSFNRDITIPVTLVEAEPMTGLTMRQTEASEYVGNLLWVYADIEGGVDRPVEWKISDESIAEIYEHGLNSCELHLLKEGQTDLTASWVDDNGQTQTAVCKVISMEPEALVLDEVKHIQLDAGESVTYKFNSGEYGGEYQLKVGRREGLDVSFGGSYDYIDNYFTDEDEVRVFASDPNSESFLVLTAMEGPVETTVLVEELHRATDIIFSTGDSVVMKEFEELDLFLEPVGGSYLPIYDIYSTDPGVVDVWMEGTNHYRLVAREAGTATINVVTADFTKSLEVTVKEYGEDIPDKWVGTMEDWDWLRFEFTPEEDGFYYFHYMDLPRIIPAEDSVKPLSDFDYDEGNYYGVVYELVGGQTYQFMTEWDIRGDYAVFAIPVEVATSFSVPATMTGAVDEVQWLEVSYEGVARMEYRSSNEDVVRVGGSGAHGVVVLMVDEGTADIIVTDQNGNEQRCTVTVSGKLPVQDFDGWREMGLAAGKSVTYSFTPWESGLYWIYSEMNADLGISLTQNGTEVQHEFSYDMYESMGEVFELTEGTEYMLTFSSDASVSTYVRAERVSLADALYLEGSNYKDMMVGETSELWYWLESESYMAVAELSAKSSDESVVKVLSCDGGHTVIQAVGGGKAQITITANGVEYGPVTVRVNDVGVLELDTPVEVSLEGYSVAYYQFTPQESGNYIFYQPNSERSFGIGSLNMDAANWEGDGRYGMVAYDLVAGEDYFVVIENYHEESLTIPFTVTKSQETTGITLGTDEVHGYAGNDEWFTIRYIPELGADARIKWSVSDPEVMEIRGDFGSMCWVRYKKAGTAVLTATAEHDSSITTSCTVIVENMPVIELGQTVEFDIGLGEYRSYSFTPETSGHYVLSLPRYSMTYVWVVDQQTGDEAHLDWGYHREHDNFYMDLEGGHTYTVNIEWYGGEDAPESNHFQAIINKSVAVTDVIVELDNDDPWYVYEPRQVLVCTDPYYAYPVDVDNVTVSDESVLNIYYVDEETAIITALAAGECTITVETSIGVTKTINVTVHPHPQLVEGEQMSVQLKAQTEKYLQFVPDQDGIYNITFTADQDTYVELGVLLGEEVGSYQKFDMKAGDSVTATVEMKAGQTCLMWMVAHEKTANVTALVQRASDQHPDGWTEIDDKWYFYENGAPKTGWHEEGGRYYYFKLDGVMATGWEKITGVWYYMEPSGARAVGWQLINGNYYYFYASGVMKTGWLNSGGKRYFFRPDGAMSTGWVQYGGKWYCMDETGAMVTGWMERGGEKYYMDADGVMVTGTVTIDGTIHEFDENGVWQGSVTPKDGWAQENGKWYFYENGKAKIGWHEEGGKYYYFGTDGAMATGWVKIGQVWYYMEPSGARATGWNLINGSYYYFYSSGVMKTGWLNSGGKRYFFRPDGAMATGWVEYAGNWYYMNESGAMVTGTYTIKGVEYKFDSNGVWIP